LIQLQRFALNHPPVATQGRGRSLPIFSHGPQRLADLNGILIQGLPQRRIGQDVISSGETGWSRG
jgi:hypothetical protein